MSEQGHVCCCCTKQEPPLPCCNAGHDEADLQPCPRAGSHVAHRWPPVDRRNRCPGVPYDDPRFRSAEELARRLNW